MPTLLQDIRHAVRSICRTPGSSAVAVLSLGIGVGGGALMASLLDGLGLRPLAVAAEERLVSVFTTRAAAREQDWSYPDYRDLRDAGGPFTGLAAYQNRGIAISSGEGDPEVLSMGVVSGNFFSLLGVRPIAGRDFLAEEDLPRGGHRVAMISAALWQRRFAGSARVFDSPVIMNNEPWTVIGVLPAAFRGLEPHLAPDVWTPLLTRPGPEREDRGNRSLKIVGRLKEGTTLARAQAEVTTLMANLAQAYPGTNRDRGAIVMFLRDARGRIATSLGPLLGTIVAIVLLIACANVAGLLLGRGEARRREMAVRVALGAGRTRLVRLCLTESALLAFCACPIGLLLALGLVRLLPAMMPPSPIPLGFVFQVDYRVLAFALVIGAIVTPVVGLTPALIASKPDVLPALRGQATAGGRIARRISLRNLLVVGQVAVSMVLLVASGLLVRSLLASQAIDPGFSQEPALLVGLAPGVAGLDGARARVFLDQLVERVSSLPGVGGVALARRVPLSSVGGGATVPVEMPGRPAEADREPDKVRYNVVDWRYFGVMKIRLVAGRNFSASDGPRSSRVVIVNEALARRYWPGGDAVGHAIRVTSEPAAEYQVIGVARNGSYLQLGEAPEPHVFFPFSQRPSGEMTLIARVHGDGGGIAAAIRREIQALSPGMPTLQVLTLKEHMRYALASGEITATLVGSTGLTGLLLAMVGLYGVVSHRVARRTRDIGIHVALGAQRGQVIAQVLAESVSLAGVGVVLGLAVALSAARLLEGSLYGVSARDPATYVATAALVIAVTVAASVLPALRAARVEPLVALRCE